ncbi:winged helix-turn-helix domain-containing protein [Dyadobacter sp. NIV53]|uniref:winged helix-turn-helix domain-containing protein n=1 Tax=Dyadobacter sp. NIV53 TaxID=2861765 RepID=UPI001E377989|nr:winged helix-turn-helix domain-containing protein [Dyadobacter sp. NIV53]
MLESVYTIWAGRIRITGVLMLLFILPFLKNNQASGNNESVRFSEKVNLALRRTAHHLLMANSDSSSSIPPIEQADANTFHVQVDHLFEYKKLPALLQESLDVYGIKRAYDVSVVNCKNGEIRLGYNFLDLNKKGGVPCENRKQEPGCYTIKVSFYPEKQVASTSENWWLVPMGSLLAGFGFIVWKKTRKEHSTPILKEIPVDADHKNHFGNSVLDLPNLILISGNNSYNLTYREAKLLNLFALNQNQILERDFILKSVWEDEGIIVGRSVDVFVSRLRKLLAEDSNIKIAAVHGIGYRMEVTS